MYDVNRASALDNPGNDRTFPDFYAFSKNVFEAAWFRPDTQIIASHGDHWVGLSAIAISSEEKYASNAFTGILREYRGRACPALKLQTILLARKEGMLTSGPIITRKMRPSWQSTASWDTSLSRDFIHFCAYLRRRKETMLSLHEIKIFLQRTPAPCRISFSS